MFAGQVGAALAIGRAVDRSFSCEVWYPGQRGRQVPLPRRPERLLDGDLEAALATRGTLETVQPRSAALQALDR
jgi:hypothetical protein